MPGSGCSALHGVNTTLKKINSTLAILDNLGKPDHTHLK